MKRMLLSIAAIISLQCFSQNNFITTMSTGGDDELYDVIQTPDGGYIGVGYTDDFNTLDNGGYIVKLNAIGQQVWNKVLPGVGEYDQIYSIINTSDGGFAVSGTYVDKIAIHKFTAAGSLSWSQQYGDLVSSEGARMIQTADGGYLVGGGISPDGGDFYQAYLIKTDGSGNVQWAKKYFNSDFSAIYDVKKTNDGNYVFITVNYSYDDLSGEYSDDTTNIVKINTSGNVIWSKYFVTPEGGSNGLSMLPLSDGGYLLTGYDWIIDAGFLLKLDGNGNYQWSKANTNNCYLYDAVEAPDGSYVAVGDSFEEDDDFIYLCKLTSAGTTVWTKAIPQDANLDLDVNRIKKTTDGGFIGVGSAYDLLSDAEPALFMKFDVNLNTCIPAISGAGLVNFGTLGNANVPVFNGSPTPGNLVPEFYSNGTPADICTALPLTLLDFAASTKATAVALQWKTAEERNTDHFEVEKSLDAKNFTTIERVAAAGNSTNTRIYETADNAPASGDNWYRLKMVDKDGQYAYSGVVKATYTGSNKAIVYPNPAIHTTTVVFNAARAGSYHIQVSDLTGKVLQTVKGVAVTGENRVSLSLSHFAKGTYMVHIKTESSKATIQLSKQ